MLERALEHVGDDLHVAVSVGAEALAGLHAILVDHAQRAEAHVARVVVLGEREGVSALEPAVAREPALVAAAHADHVRELPAARLGSRLQIPEPFVAMNKKMKQKSTALSPLFWIGNSARPWCAMK